MKTAKKLAAYAIIYSVSSLLLWALLANGDISTIWIAFALVALTGAVGAGIVWAINQIHEP